MGTGESQRVAPQTNSRSEYEHFIPRPFNLDSEILLLEDPMLPDQHKHSRSQNHTSSSTRQSTTPANSNLIKLVFQDKSSGKTPRCSRKIQDKFWKFNPSLGGPWVQGALFSRFWSKKSSTATFEIIIPHHASVVKPWYLRNLKKICRRTASYCSTRLGERKSFRVCWQCQIPSVK